QVPPLLDDVRQPVAVGDTGDILLDDRPFVQLVGHIMTGGADQLYAANEGPVVRAGAAERRKKGVVHVDDPQRKARDKVGRQYLHVASEYYQVDLVLF